MFSEQKNRTLLKALKFPLVFLPVHFFLFFFSLILPFYFEIIMDS